MDQKEEIISIYPEADEKICSIPIDHNTKKVKFII
jgi:hypothetical protein